MIPFAHRESRARSIPRTLKIPLAHALVVFLAIALHWSSLRHAGIVNSDAALVGLQAKRILRGEFAPMLLGSAYQSSADAWVTALFFLIFGVNSHALTFAMFAEHLAVVLFIYSVLCRQVGRVKGVFFSLLLCMPTDVVDIYALRPPRETSLLLSILAAWLVLRARSKEYDERVLALAGALGSLAVFADPYAAVFVGPMALIGIRRAMARTSGRTLAVKAYLAGAGGGLLPVGALWFSHRKLPAEVVPSIAHVTRGADLLFFKCLPAALGLLSPSIFEPPPILLTFLYCVSLVMLLVFVTAASLLAIRRESAVRNREPAIFALAVIASNLIAFCLAPSAIDEDSFRYLIAVYLVLPILLAAASHWAPRAHGVVMAVPLILLSFFGGIRGRNATERYISRLEEADKGLEWILRSQGVSYGSTNYWLAYRFTFLMNEEIVLVPREASSDRLPAYRARVDHAARVALIFDKEQEPDVAALAVNPIAGMRVETPRYVVIMVDRSTAAEAASSR